MNYYLEDTLSKIEKWSVKNLIKYGFSSSNKFRDSILENGLLPKYSGTWSYDLEYPPAVFAINGVDSKGNEYWFPHSKDIWRINTKKLPNQWRPNTALPPAQWHHL